MLINRSSLSNLLRFARESRVIMAGVVFLTVSCVSGWALLAGQAHNAQAASGARDCDANAIMRCGALTKSEFVQKYQNNAPGDLHRLYALFSLTQGSQINSAQDGKVYKDGHITVGGKTVATGAWSVGRQNIAGSVKRSYKGTTYYSRMVNVSFASSPLDAFVVMKKDGTPAFVVIKSCGNPVGYKPVPPPKKPAPKPPKPHKPAPKPKAAYRCDMLHMQKNSETDYTFTSNVSYKNATLIKLIYDFGDGNTAEVKSPSQQVPHTYKPGSYLARVTAYFNVKGQMTSDTRESCTQPITVSSKPTPPPAAPTQPSQPAPTPPAQALPETGTKTAAVGGALGLGSIAGAAYYWIVSRRSMIARLLGQM